MHRKRERNPNITLKIVIKSQGKRAKEKETKKDSKINPRKFTKSIILYSKQPPTNKNKWEKKKENSQNDNKYISTKNYFKCK